MALLREPSLYSIKAILILDNDGSRIVAKYYDGLFPTYKEQRTWEKKLYNKTHRESDYVTNNLFPSFFFDWVRPNFLAEVTIMDNLTIVYRENVDLFFYVIGSANENELILQSVLSTLYDSVSYLLKKNFEKSGLLENMDSISLILDEICDQGIILENDALAIYNRCSLKGDEISLGEQTVAQVLQTAKDQLKWSLLKN